MASHPEFCRLSKEGETELIVKKSRFIGRAFPIREEAEALQHLERLRKAHWDASHNCYAYIVGENGQIARYSDDGEPGGTAGMPMMQVLQMRQIRDTLVIVTRYFGGTLLGAGGLVRAYSKATSQALDAAHVQRMIWSSLLTVRLDYTQYGRFENFLRQSDAQLLGTEFAEQVQVQVCLRAERKDTFIKAVTELSDGRAGLEEDGEEYAAWPDEAPDTKG